MLSARAGDIAVLSLGPSLPRGEGRQTIAFHGQLALGLQIGEATLAVLSAGIAVFEHVTGVLEQLLAPSGDPGGV